jgi:hypothetical protein
LFALDTLELGAEFHEKIEPKFAAELANREKILGPMLDSRRGLRIRYVEPRREMPPSHANGRLSA